MSNESAVKHFAGEFIERKGCGRAGEHCSSIGLRNRHVNAKSVNRRQVKEFFAWSSRARINQGADVSVTRSDHAVKRSVHFLEGLQLFEPTSIGGIRLDRGF